MILLTDQEIIRKIIEKIIHKRKNLKCSQKELAQKSGLSFRTIQTMEAGVAPNLKSLIAILRALGELHRLDTFLEEESISPKKIHMESLNEKKRNNQPS
jgi:transcriptional regulator with XRE-family HTH domain